MHVLPNGFHRIRHFGILANSNAKSTMEKLAEHTAPNAATDDDERQCDNDTHDYVPKCPACQRPLNLIGEFLPDDYRLVCLARAPPLTSARLMTRLEQPWTVAAVVASTACARTAFRRSNSAPNMSSIVYPTAFSASKPYSRPTKSAFRRSFSLN